MSLHRKSENDRKKKNCSRVNYTWKRETREATIPALEGIRTYVISVQATEKKSDKDCVSTREGKREKARVAVSHPARPTQTEQEIVLKHPRGYGAIGFPWRGGDAPSERWKEGKKGERTRRLLPVARRCRRNERESADRLKKTGKNNGGRDGHEEPEILGRSTPRGPVCVYLDLKGPRQARPGHYLIWFSTRMEGGFTACGNDGFCAGRSFFLNGGLFTVECLLGCDGLLNMLFRKHVYLFSSCMLCLCLFT